MHNHGLYIYMHAYMQHRDWFSSRVVNYVELRSVEYTPTSLQACNSVKAVYVGT